MPRQRKTDYARPLPNAGSNRQTVASKIFDIKHSTNEGWTWERFIRLASSLTLTPEELASYACMRHSQVPLFQFNNRITGISRAPLELILTLIERHHVGSMTGTPDPFPKL